MAVITLSESKFKLIPEGYTVFRVMEVDDSKYENFGKLEVKLQTAKGETHREKFTLKDSKGKLNEKALGAWSYFARVCVNNNNCDEIDTDDIVGCYIGAVVSYRTYTNKDGKDAKAVQLKDWKSESAFENDGFIPVDDSEEDDLDW